MMMVWSSQVEKWKDSEIACDLVLAYEGEGSDYNSSEVSVFNGFWAHS